MTTVTIYQMNGRKDVIKLHKGTITRKDAARISEGFVTDDRKASRNSERRIATIYYKHQYEVTAIFWRYNELVFFPHNDDGESVGQRYVDAPNAMMSCKPDLTTCDTWFCMPRTSSLIDKLTDVDDLTYFYWPKGAHEYDCCGKKYAEANIRVVTSIKAKVNQMSQCNRHE